MELFSSMVWQGILFSGSALLLIGLSVWWLYASPMKQAVRAAVAPSARLSVGLAAVLGVSAGLMVVGGLWDASMHIRTGEVPGGSDFLWPPHLMIYGGFLLSFLVALVAIGVVGVGGRRMGTRDPRAWVRRSPYLGALALASAYSLLSVPGDALWHELFGIDLTAWSPPHVLLAATGATVIVCAVGLLARARAVVPRLGWIDAWVVVLLSLMLNLVYIIGVLEWELPGGQTRFVQMRPIWFYPLVGGGLAFFTFVLAKRLIRNRWAATFTALGFYAVRLSIAAGLGLTGNVQPHLPLLFILGAVLLDAVPWRRVGLPPLRMLAVAALFTAGYAVLALPVLALRNDLAGFRSVDFFFAVAATLVLSMLLFPLARLAGRRLRGAGAKEPMSRSQAGG